ncbi:MAG: hypothetical protein ACE5JS_23150, partial [Nitrospinota bacterium]
MQCVPFHKQAHPKHPEKSPPRFCRLNRLSSAGFVLPVIAATLAGCVSTEDFNRVVSERDRWRTSARALESENKHLRERLDQWMKAHKVLEDRVKSITARPAPVAIPRQTVEENNRLKSRVENYEKQLTALEAEAQKLREDRNAYRNWYQIYRKRFNQAVLREQQLQRRSMVYERMVKNLEKEVEKGNL